VPHKNHDQGSAVGSASIPFRNRATDTSPDSDRASIVRRTLQRLRCGSALTGLALLAAPVPPALAECSTSGTVVTCTGDLSAGVYQEFDGGGTETQTVTVRDLTADVGQEGVTFYDPGTPASSTGGTGVTGANLSVTIATSPYAIDSGADGVEVGSEGGDGKTGASKTTGSGNATGGAGGSGALAGTVALMLEDGAVTTSGGTAVSVVSLGGSGGMGGSGTGGVYGNGYGGVGGIGGDGGTVSFDAAGDAVQIQTSGDASRAITGFSRGGNGGTGGTGWSPNIIARGGAAGTGGDGRDVTIGLSADGSVVATSGDSANAISAESRGGSGGTGGTANAVQFGDAYGGDGGAGGAGGTVTVDVVADLTTLGDASQAIFAKSYGGRGGDGGSASGGRGTGGANLGGGAAGAASVTFGGTITTSGDEANGILAQSVGGFSGDEADISGLVAYGADSQSAGGGDDVNVTVRSGATIATAGASADGIFAQSQGGGGGKGSTQVNVVALGGSGLAAGDGGTVIVESFGESIMTSGERSRAVHASSGGGTGGDSGNAYGIVSIGSSGGLGGAGGEVSVTNTAALTTTGDYSEAFFATSVGGGAGAGHSTVGIVAVGGDGGQGGHGGSVTAAHSGGDILTTGESADGIFLQSVGGGGGKSSSQYSISAGVSVAIGGRGGEASDGADVTFDDGGEGGYTISTEGDKSYGIFAQSAGGGGGRAGKNISASGSPVLSIAVGAAGDGGGGGDGGAVSLTASGDVSTKGVASTAISVQSIGNGGGAVGTVVAAAASTKFGFELALGATGGDGGDGGTVTVRSDGALSTEGKTAHGIEALSIGDGGGSGGTTIAAGLQTTAAVAVGSSGGGGGDGAAVVVTGSGAIQTGGDNAKGILAQSIGGGGGNSGTTVASDVGINRFEASVGVGGSGGNGGDGGTVNVDYSGDITTLGASATGLHAQSISRGGGNADLTIGAGVAGKEALSVAVSVGGSGGSGGNADAVSVTSRGAISTAGKSAEGIRAESIGGSGGNAVGTIAAAGASGFTFLNQPSRSISVSVGGSGGDGGTAGKVNVINEGAVTTTGERSSGIVALSQGGAGGKGAFSGAVTGWALQDLQVAIGGSGGGGNVASDASVENRGVVTTSGDYASGIKATSQGGDGGDAGLTFTGGLTISKFLLAGFRGNVSVQIGGDGGGGNTAGAVNVVNANSVATSGYYAHGINAESLGGTGGTAAVGNTDWLPDTGNDEVDSVLEEIVSVGGTIYTSTQIYNRFTVAVGGNGGAAGDGGSVAVTNSGTVTTAGDSAHGILAQSVGGGGGNGGDATNSIISLFTLGGDGTATGVGGAVSVKSDGDIETAGNQAMGIFAQSTGGSGGTAGTVGSILAKEYGSNAIVFGLPIGGSDSDDYLENAGGDVTVETTGAITTTGANGHGIFVQSVGGGGGAREASSGDEADPDDLGQVGSSGFAGSGGDVTVRALGDITVTGEDSVGIFAQSAAGAYGDGGTVTIEVGGDIYASGDGSRAIMASASAVNPIDQGVNMNITVNEGASVRTGPDGGETIALFYGENPFNSGNATNSLTNYGLIESSEILDEIDPQASYVVRFEDVLESADLDRYELADMNAGPLAIDNYGIMNGSVALADGQPNAVDNREGATLGLGYDYDLGSAGSLTNSGTMSAATKGTVGRSVVTAPTVVQSDTGVLWVDIDHRAQTADYIAFETSGVSAVMAGKVTADVDRPLFVPFGARGTVPILYAGDGSIDITDLTVDSTLFAKYTLEKTAEDTAETVTLSYTVWFDSPGFDLGSGHRDFGGYLGGLVDSRRGELESGEGGRHAWVEGIIDQLVTTTSTDVYLGYTPDFYFAPINTSFTSNLAFTDALLGCPDNLLDDGIGAARDGTETARDGACRWFQATGRSTDRNPSSGYGAYSEEAFAFAGGFQTEIRDNLLGGLAASYETSSLDGNLNSNGSADRFQLGGVLKTDRQGWTLASSLSGGVMLSDLNREIIVPETGSTFAQASPQTSFVSAALSAERVFQMGNAYLKPSLSAGVTYLHQNGFDETGVDLYGMQVGSANVTTYWANPALEIGTDIAGAKHSTRAFLRAGVLLSDSAGDDLDVAFLADPGDGFTIADDQPRALADLSAGLEMQLRDNISLRFNGGALFGDDYVSYGGNARISFGF